MAQQRQLEKARKQAYQVVLSTDAGQDMLDDLINFAQFCGDPIRALGRADVVLRMERERKRVIEETESDNEHGS